MSFNREAYDTIEEALKLLKAKSNHPYPRMVGYLQSTFGDVESAKQILKLVEEWEGDK